MCASCEALVRYNNKYICHFQLFELLVYIIDCDRNPDQKIFNGKSDIPWPDGRRLIFRIDINEKKKIDAMKMYYMYTLYIYAHIITDKSGCQSS